MAQKFPLQLEKCPFYALKSWVIVLFSPLAVQKIGRMGPLQGVQWRFFFGFPHFHTQHDIQVRFLASDLQNGVYKGILTWFRTFCHWTLVRGSSSSSPYLLISAERIVVISAEAGSHRHSFTGMVCGSKAVPTYGEVPFLCPLDLESSSIFRIEGGAKVILEVETYRKRALQRLYLLDKSLYVVGSRWKSNLLWEHVQWSTSTVVMLCGGSIDSFIVEYNVFPLTQCSQT